MNVGDLKRLLEDFDDDSEVRFASQPSWPFEYSVADVVETDPADFNDFDREEDNDEDQLPVIYLVEGRQLDYLPGHVKDLIGW